MSVSKGMDDQSEAPGSEKRRVVGEDDSDGGGAYVKALKVEAFRGEQGEPKILKVVWGPEGDVRLMRAEEWQR